MLRSLGKGWNFISNKLYWPVNSNVWTVWNKPVIFSWGDSSSILQAAISFLSPYYLIPKSVLKIFTFIFFIRKGAGCTGWEDDLCANNYSCSHALHTILSYVFSSDKNVTAWGQLLSAVLLSIILQRVAFGITALNITTGQQEKLHSYCLTIQRKHLLAREG